MATQLYSHPSCIEHDPGNHHPECPDRLRSVMAGLDDDAFRHLQRLEAPEISLNLVNAVHGSRYVENLLDNVPKQGRVSLDADTVMSSASGEAAMRASGGAVAAVDAVIAKKADNAFCAIRPPGHHAESSRAMGFCLFNSAAIAAFHARASHGLERVAVIDFDVHHGNGTQHSFENEPGLFYGSSHQYPAYPGTGARSETGVANNICNAPLAPGAGSKEFRDAYQNGILPALRFFSPELLIISAGFDAHARDPLAQLNVQTEDYAWVTRALMDVADEYCDGRVVSLLEGGYDLDALRESAVTHVRTLMDV
ncbi:MAG: histone deacetylase family protein [Rhodospirillales bacterium]|nr:histone deacetylase family protein [Rhodospirillales bacterium]